MKKSTRKLALRIETVRTLTSDQLGAVAGGSGGAVQLSIVGSLPASRIASISAGFTQSIYIRSFTY